MWYTHFYNLDMCNIDTIKKKRAWDSKSEGRDTWQWKKKQKNKILMCIQIIYNQTYICTRLIHVCLPYIYVHDLEQKIYVSAKEPLIIGLFCGKEPYN